MPANRPLRLFAPCVYHVYYADGTSSYQCSAQPPRGPDAVAWARVAGSR